LNLVPNDIELVEKLQKGDVEAFDLIYDKYSGKLYSFGLKYLRSNSEAEELVQSVFLKVWENYKNLKKESSFKSYLFTIAYNDICKLFRKRNYHHKIQKNEDQKRKKLIHRITRVYIKIAAILMLPLLITGGLFYKHYLNQSLISIDQVVSSSIYAPMGARVSFNLPDGTVGMLNSGSQLCYSLPFTNKREITLEGEAWLDVCHNEIHPFKITSGTSSLRVFGTKFNLSAYPTEHYVEVVLEEGKVDYLNQEASIAVTMSPSERLVFENGQISRSNTDPSKYNAWTQGKLVFRGDPMSEVARRIER